MKCTAREWVSSLLIAGFFALQIHACATPSGKLISARLDWRHRLVLAPAVPLGLLASRSVLCIPLRLSGDPSLQDQPPVYSALIVDRRTRKPLYRLPGYPISLDDARVVLWAPSASLSTPDAAKGTDVSSSTESPKNVLICYDLHTRRRKWECTVPIGTECFSCTRVGEALCCPFSLRESRGQTLRLIRLDSGRIIAERNWPDDWAIGPPAFDGKAIYYGVGHALMALNPQTLTSRWSLYDGGNANPQMVGSVLVTFGWDNSVQGINPQTGRVLWRRYAPREQGSYVVPEMKQPTLSFEAYSLDNAPWIQHLACVNAQTGKALWYRAMDGYKPVAAATGLIYVAGTSLQSGAGGFAALDAATGATRWRYEKPGLGGVALIVDRQDIVGLGSDGFLYGFHRSIR